VSTMHVERVDRRSPVVRVPLGLRWQLWRAAGQDRRAGLPLGISPATTPMLAELAALYSFACERERSRFLADEAGLTVDLHRLEARLRGLTRAAEERRSRVEQLSHPTGEDWLGTRFPGEGDLPDTVTRARRAVAHRRQVEAAEAALRTAVELVEDAQVHVADVESRLRRNADVARSRVQRHREVAHRRAAVYRRTLLRRHPDRDELVRRWSTDLFPVPSWAVDMPVLPGAAALEVSA
jgi:hypothetical protein